jgi:hypothetical protein
MASAETITLAWAHFEDADLGAFVFAQNGCLDFGSLDHWLTDLHIITVRNEQNPFELNFVSGFMG